MDVRGVLASNSEPTAKLIKKIARRLSNKPYFPPDSEKDIEQELRLRLLKALDRFDSKRGTLGAFIHRVIANEEKKIIDSQMSLKNRMARNSEPYQNLPSPDDDNQPAQRIDVDAYIRMTGQGPYPDEDAQDRALDVAEFISALPSGLKAICEYLCITSISETARICNLSRTTVSRRCKEIRLIAELRGLRDYLE